VRSSLTPASPASARPTPAPVAPHRPGGFIRSMPPARVAQLGFFVTVLVYRRYRDAQWRFHRYFSWWAPAPMRRARRR